MAINPGRVFGQVKGIAARDPAFGMEALWIEPTDRDHAQSMGYTVVDAGTVIATHLSHIIQSHAHELLGHEEVNQLLANVAKTAPKLVEDLVPRVLPMAVLVRVLQSLLSERVPLLAKCIVMVPIVMVLLGAELELRLSPKLNVILTGAVAWGMWAWLSGTSRLER